MTIFLLKFKLKLIIFSFQKSRMRTLLSTEQNSSSIYPKYTTVSKSYKPDTTNRYTRNENEPIYAPIQSRSVKLPIERQDLSPVSRFREEQKGALFNANLSSANKTSCLSNKYNQADNKQESNTIPIYSSSLLYAELPEMSCRNPNSIRYNKSKINSFKNIENKTSTLNYCSTNASGSKYEKNSLASDSTPRPTARFNNPYKLIKYSDNEDDKLF